MLVVPSPRRRGRVGRDVHVRRPVAKRSEVAGLQQARARVGGLGAVDAIELGRMPDRIRVPAAPSARRRWRPSSRRPDRGRHEAEPLPPRRLAEPDDPGPAPRRAPSRPARSSRCVRSGSSGSERGRRGSPWRSIPPPALEELLEQVAAFGRPENPSFAHCSDARRGHGNVRAVELRSSARRQSSTFRSSGSSSRIAVAGVCGSPPMWGASGSSSTLRLADRRARPGEGNRSDGRISGAAFVELPVARESPGRRRRSTRYADPGSLGVVDGVDAAVTRRDVLGPAASIGAGVGIAGTRADRSV